MSTWVETRTLTSASSGRHLALLPAAERNVRRTGDRSGAARAAIVEGFHRRGAHAAETLDLPLSRRARTSPGGRAARVPTSSRKTVPPCARSKRPTFPMRGRAGGMITVRLLPWRIAQAALYHDRAVKIVGVVKV